MFKFPKNEYRIEETRYRDGSGFYTVHIKCWWYPVWKPLKMSMFSDIFCEPARGYRRIDLNFNTKTDASAFAENHARDGKSAFFVKSETYTYTGLGKLPKD